MAAGDVELILDAACTFADGAPRTRLQRPASMDAHRAAPDAPSEPARLAAQPQVSPARHRR